MFGGLPSLTIGAGSVHIGVGGFVRTQLATDAPRE